MMTILESARSGRITPEMKRIAKLEGVSAEFIRKGVARGTIVIPKNRLRRISGPCGIGAGLKTKVNANIGTSRDSSSVSGELKKMRVAIDCGSDTIMDLSTGRGLCRTRRAILKKCSVPLGTVPIYETVVAQLEKGAAVKDIRPVDFISALRTQALDGVDFFTIHAGVTQRTLKALRDHPRVLGIVSRGGAFLAEWMTENGRENPFYEYFDKVIDIARSFDITLSLGDGLRPGSIIDATDPAQITELMALGSLRKRAMKRGVQVIIEGPGHVPINQIETNVLLEKVICGGAPFYILGPLVTDVAPGYDHITAAIGGALAASKGADFLCYVTPAEHLRLPTLDDVLDGVVASRIAAHAADIAKGVKGALIQDMEMSRARGDRDWKKQFGLAIEGSKPRKYRKSSKPSDNDACTMCGEYCSMKISEKCFGRRN